MPYPLPSAPLPRARPSPPPCPLEGPSVSKVKSVPPSLPRSAPTPPRQPRPRDGRQKGPNSGHPLPPRHQKLPPLSRKLSSLERQCLKGNTPSLGPNGYPREWRSVDLGSLLRVHDTSQRYNWLCYRRATLRTIPLVACLACIFASLKLSEFPNETGSEEGRCLRRLNSN